MMAATYLLQMDRGFRACPMQAVITGMLSVKKKHSLGVNFRRRAETDVQTCDNC